MKTYIVIKEFKTICCDHRFYPGETLEIYNDNWSKNRMLITSESGGHKVKKSTFFHSTKEAA